MHNTLPAQRQAVPQSLAGIEIQTQEIIAAIPDLNDGDLLEVRKRARNMGRCAWQIECAADAEVLKRISAKAGRRPDTQKAGITAAVEKHARELGVQPSTVFANARLYSTFFVTLSAQSNKEQYTAALLDKTFYLMALRSDNPHEALAKIAHARELNPAFSSRDAQRLVSRPKQPIESKTDKPPTDNPAIQTAWERYREALQELQRVAELAGLPLKRILAAHRDEVWHEIDRPQSVVANASREGQARAVVTGLGRIARNFPFFKIPLEEAMRAVETKAQRTLERDEQEVVNALTEGDETANAIASSTPSKIPYEQVYKVLRELEGIGYVRRRFRTTSGVEGRGGVRKEVVWTLE